MDHTAHQGQQQIEQVADQQNQNGEQQPHARYLAGLLGQAIEGEREGGGGQPQGEQAQVRQHIAKHPGDPRERPHAVQQPEQCAVDIAHGPLAGEHEHRQQAKSERPATGLAQPVWHPLCATKPHGERTQHGGDPANVPPEHGPPPLERCLFQVGQHEMQDADRH